MTKICSTDEYKSAYVLQYNHTDDVCLAVWVTLNTTHPHAPPDDCVAMSVPGGAHDARVDEFGGDVGIDDANHKSWDNNKSEGALPVFLGSQATKGRRSRVLPQISETDGRRNYE